ncbi:MAG: hydrogenase maturation protease [Abditibacteriales bacterium]|nr:hydrogenase maturation protease [Abditibacteriales bacterium]MDW8367139.1 hydrogenase maturation protease [Abditibacteriales bacterium]
MPALAATASGWQGRPPLRCLMRTVQSMIRVLGVGNPLMGDDGVGIAVIEYLWRETVPQGVEVVDAGTGGLDLVHLIEEADAAVIVDAVEMGAAPGTLKWFRPQDVKQNGELCHLSLHETRLGAVLQWLAWLNIRTPVWILGIQPAAVRLGAGLSLPVQRAVPQAAQLIHEFVGAGVSASPT